MLLFSVLVSVVHIVLDTLKAVCEKKKSGLTGLPLFLVDQFLHLMTIVVLLKDFAEYYLIGTLAAC